MQTFGCFGVPSYLQTFFTSVKETLPDSPFAHINTWEALQQELLATSEGIDQWILRKSEIQNVIKNLPKYNLKVDLDDFIIKIMEAGFKTDPQKTMAFLADIIELDDLTNSLVNNKSYSEFKNFDDWAAEEVNKCASPPHHQVNSIRSNVWHSYKHILCFIPNVVNTLLGSLNILDTGNLDVTIWDKYLILTILAKTLEIPSYIITAIRPYFDTSTKAYVAGTMIILGIVVITRLIGKLFDFHSVIYTENLNQAYKNGEIEPAIGQDKESDEILNALRIGKSVIIVGESGIGKTKLMHHVVTKIEDEQALLGKTIRKVDTAALIGNNSFGHAAIMRRIMSELLPTDIPFIDQLKQIVNISTVLDALEDKFMKGTKKIQFVGALTSEEFEVLRKKDDESGGSFLSEVEVIRITSTPDTQIRLIVLNEILKKAPDIHVTDKAVDKIVELSKLGKGGIPRKALKLLDKAIGECRGILLSPKYVLPKLIKKRQYLKSLYLRMQVERSRDPLIEAEIKEMKSSIDKWEEKSSVIDSRIKKVKTVYAERQQLEKTHHGLMHRISMVSTKPPIHAKDKVLVLLYVYHGIFQMKALIEKQIKEVPTQIPVQIDESLLERLVTRPPRFGPKS